MISLSWTQGTVGGLGSFTSYTVGESTTGSNGPWQTVGTVTSQSTTTYDLAGLSPATTYWWEVTLNCAGLLGCGSQTSNVLNFTQPALAHLTYTLPNPTHATFNWTNNATYGGDLTFISYQLYESVNGSAVTAVASISTSATLSFTVSGILGAAGYSFYLVTTDCLACGGGQGTQQGTNSNTVTFGTPQTLIASLASARPAIDVGEANLFTCSASGGTPSYNFSWDFGNGSRVAGNYSESHAYATSGIETVTCYVSDASHGSASSVATVSVNPAPSVAVTANVTAADAGQSVGFSCATANGTQPFASLYQWNFGDGTVAQTAVPSAQHTYASAGPYLATCLAKDAAQVSATGNVSVRISHALGVTIEPASTTVASGFALNLTAVASNGSGTYTRYAWNFPGGVTATGRTASHAFPTAGGNGTVTVAVTDSHGQTVRATASLTVAAIVVAIASVSTSTRTGTALTFSATATGGAGGPYTYAWTFGDGSTATGATTTHSFSKADRYAPTVRVTDRLGASTVATVPTISVSTAPPATPLIPWWGWVVVAAVAIALIAFVLIARRRRKESEKLRSAAPWAPPTAPKHTVLGSKICPSCGSSNVRLRTTCEVCGTDLPGR